MEEGKKITWILLFVTLIGALIALSRYIFPWSSFFMDRAKINSSGSEKISSKPLPSVFPSLKPVPNVSYSLKQATSHNTTDDCWLVLKGEVYDLSPVTRVYKQIPNVNQICGKDITQALDPVLKQYGLKDSAQLISVLNQYAIGKIK